MGLHDEDTCEPRPSVGQTDRPAGKVSRDAPPPTGPSAPPAPAVSCEGPQRPSTHLGALLAAVAIPFIPFSSWRLLAQPSENDALTMGSWVLITALVLGFAERTVHADQVALAGKVTGKRKRPDADRPFQFGLSDLLGGVFILALLMGIWSTSQERDMPGAAWSAMFESTWDLLYGCLLTISAVLFVAGWRRKDISGLALSIPILMGTVVHFAWHGALDDAVFLGWSSYALIFGCVLHVRWSRWLERCSWRRGRTGAAP